MRGLNNSEGQRGGDSYGAGEGDRNSPFLKSMIGQKIEGRRRRRIGRRRMGPLSHQGK